MAASSSVPAPTTKLHDLHLKGFKETVLPNLSGTLQKARFEWTYIYDGKYFSQVDSIPDSQSVTSVKDKTGNQISSSNLNESHMPQQILVPGQTMPLGGGQTGQTPAYDVGPNELVTQKIGVLDQKAKEGKGKLNRLNKEVYSLKHPEKAKEEGWFSNKSFKKQKVEGAQSAATAPTQNDLIANAINAPERVVATTVQLEKTATTIQPDKTDQSSQRPQKEVEDDISTTKEKVADYELRRQTLVALQTHVQTGCASNKLDVNMTEVRGEYTSMRVVKHLFKAHGYVMLQGFSPGKSTGIDQIWKLIGQEEYLIVEAKGSENAKLGATEYGFQMSPKWVYHDLAFGPSSKNELAGKVLAAMANGKVTGLIVHVDVDASGGPVSRKIGKKIHKGWMLKVRDANVYNL